MHYTTNFNASFINILLLVETKVDLLPEGEDVCVLKELFDCGPMGGVELEHGGDEALEGGSRCSKPPFCVPDLEFVPSERSCSVRDMRPSPISKIEF